MSRVSPFLWFDREAEPAAALYVSLIPNSRITGIQHAPAGIPNLDEGDVLTVSFELDGLPVQALNGGPLFPFTEAISLVITADTQPEIDRLWDGLTANGGSPGQCGWLKDPYGLSWQIVPTALDQLIADPDPARAARAVEAMLSMGKLDLAALQAAADG